MSSPDYYLTDSILVEYDGGGEIVNRMRIDRSKAPRWVGKLAHGQSVIQWIEDNEELVTRVVYEGGIWNVKTWESVFYTEELAELNIPIASVIKISRAISYKIK